MESHAAIDGALLYLTGGGIVSDVIYCQLPFLLEKGALFAAILDPSSTRSFLELLNPSADGGPILESQLGLKTGPSSLVCDISLQKSGNQIIVCLARTRMEIFLILEQAALSGVTLPAGWDEYTLAGNRRYRQVAAGSIDDLSALNNELVNLQRELARKNAELERVSAMKDLVLGMVAHDLRNPLCVITMGAAILAHKLKELMPGEYISQTDAIIRSADTMNNIIEDLLDLKGLENGPMKLKKSRCRPGDIFKSFTEAHIDSALEKELELVTDIDDNLPEMELDKSKMERVINNLISNAVKYSQKKGTVRVIACMDENTLIIDVKDSGPGIPAGEENRLFQPYSQLSTRPTAGERSIGLGLYITARIVAAHGGTISAANAPEGGAVFTVRLPVSV